MSPPKITEKPIVPEEKSAPKSFFDRWRKQAEFFHPLKDWGNFRQCEAYFHSLLEYITEGFALYEILEDENGLPNDYRFLEVNEAFEKLTGLKRKNILYKPRSSILGGGDPQFTKTYREVAVSGVPIRFVDYSKALGRYYNVLAFQPTKGHLAVLFNDVTAQKQEDAAKNNFIAIMAHELRNPLMPIFTNTEILDIYLSKDSRRRRYVDTKIKESVGIIARQASTMGKLLDDLLDISRIIRGKITLNKKLILLCQSAQNAIESAMPLMKSQKHVFSFSPPSSPIYINADPIRIEQVITNLLNNAAKYTKPGGHISLVITEAGGVAEIKVRDTGIGIPPQDINKLFELFLQLSKPFVETRGDIGIGLKLIKDIVVMHGGTITAKSEGINKGSEFIVHLPTIPAPKLLETKTETQEKHLPLTKRKILVVDDNIDISTSLQELLLYLGHEVSVANDGANTISMTENFKPELILLDIGLPDMTGYEVAHLLRKKYGEKIKLVALTGYGQEKDRILSKEAGFDYHLTKPASIGDINTIIKKCFPAQKP